MRSQRSSGRAGICVIVLAGMIGAMSLATSREALAAEAVTDANVADAIAAAKTQQDHEAIAAYFRAQAAAQGEKVALHEAMLKGWEKTVSGKSLEHMRKHCHNLIQSFRNMQKEYEAMAEMHAHMAKGTK